MNHSLYSADRTTHLRIVAVALVCAVAVVGVVLAAYGAAGDRTAKSQRVEALIPLVKAGGPMTFSSNATPVIR